MCIAGGRVIDFEAIQSQRQPRAGANRTLTHSAHTHLYFEGDERTSIQIIESGWVKLYRTLIDGQRQVVGFANDGAVLGLESEAEHGNSCETITDVVVRTIPLSQLTEFLGREPDLAARLLHQVGAQLNAAQAQLVTIGAQSAEQKLASFLIAMARRSIRPDNDEFDLPMRRGEMAEFLGLRLETVSRKMSEFQRRGWIRMTTMYHCRLLQPAVLSSLADGGDAASAGLSASV